MKLWYDKPARFWHEALPIGNGRMGGMVHGGQEGISFELTDADLEQIPTDESLCRVQADERDIGLMELYFQYGRYLLMSSSRKGSLPTNLQGIWEHYLYTGDAAFLREHFDVLEQCVTFFYDFLIEDEEGNLETSPSLSPENTYERADD